jgi:hypothetical protein
MMSQLKVSECRQIGQVPGPRSSLEVLDLAYEDLEQQTYPAVQLQLTTPVIEPAN